MTDTPGLTETLDQAWGLLDLAISEGRSPLRYVTLATVDGNAAPQVRIVVLRKVDRASGQLTAYTDKRSDKVGQLRQNPQVALHLWSPDNLVQLRMNGTAWVTQGSVEAWDAVPEHMREAYGHVPPPGTTIDRSDDWAIRPDPAYFAALDITLSRIESVCLDPAGHRRANFERADGWIGHWLSP
ncbi:pyridoxamine 5'-phosphate oxidase family protein [Ruegeria jejuensis]|uniref:pyridoxamine 5'-phosphate oxidase family protein n=1 Tax=Ruegeria jejuensis TaxID=3233338 RepID=UPI00355C7EE5